MPVTGLRHMHRYRPDIDGLRAVAIVPVLLFHAGVGAFSGGFVGVDVFFVISGFLITGLIRHEMDSGSFSIANFYERRIRRILPALFAMMIVTAALSAWLLLPGDLADFGKSVAGTSLFASNFLFWQESGYFAPAAEETPLLHTWSLAVEEQFYILFPLFLAFVASRPGKPYVAATVAVVVPSFLLSVAGVAFARDAAFYLAPFRAWELGLGALLALGVVRPSHDVRVRNAAALAGAAAIAWSVFQYSAGTAFPGAAALLPCVGAAAIIWAGSGGHNLVGDALSWRPVVLVGLVSYSLYLWHWPLLALGRYYAVRDLTAVETTVVLAVAALAAVASWRYVERPFRGKSGILDRRQLFRTTVAVTGGAVRSRPRRRRCVGLAGPHRRGHPARAGGGRRSPFPRLEVRQRGSRVGRRRHALPHRRRARRRAELPAVGRFAWSRRGRRGRRGGQSRRTVGRARGAHRLLAVARRAAQRPRPRTPLRGVQPGGARQPGADATDRGCGADGTLGPACGGTALWPGARRGDLPGRRGLDGTVERGESTDLRPLARRCRVEPARHGQARLDRRLGAGGGLGRAVDTREIRTIRPRPSARTVPTGLLQSGRRSYSTALARLDARPGVVVLRPDAVMCGPDRCEVTRDGLPLYFDSHHLSRLGTQLLEPMFDEVFAR